MAAVERVEYVDNMRNMQLEQVIRAERKIQRKYIAEQEVRGGLIPVPPTPPAKYQTPVQAAGVPPHVLTIKADPGQSMSTNTSTHLWYSACPGYIVRDGPRMASAMKKDYVYDQEEIDCIKSQGFTHNRRRDKFVLYVEAHAKMNHLYKEAAGK